ncbi:hypothetical protein BH11PSE8_BH11PSE8_04600 [soil metagenome]
MLTTPDVRTVLPLESRFPTDVLLRAGETHLMRLASGSDLIVSRGELTLVEPVRWLGEIGAPARLRLRSGESHRIDVTGWFTLTATRDCELLWVAHCRAAPAMFDSARRIATWLRSRARSSARSLSNACRGLALRARHALHTA